MPTASIPTDGLFTERVSGTDPSTTEEYWNYILYKNIGTELATDLNNWLDHGSTVPDGPANIPELEIPEGQIFRILESSQDLSATEVSIEFRSDAGFTYAIEYSTNLVEWTEVASNIIGQTDQPST